MLKDVTILSTVSGGTLVGAMYALSLKKEITFGDFYVSFYNFLTTSNLVRSSLKILGDPAGNALGFLNLSTSIASSYDDQLFKGETFGLFWDGKPIHLKDIIFNATEFKSGVGFRFQKSSRSGARIGNGKVHIAVRDAMSIRLADIAAASACFPGGFEPLAFPNDLRWPNDVIPPALVRDFKEPVGLMDGGVYDNQGIEAAYLASKQPASRVDLFIISDTFRPNEYLYLFPRIASHSRLTLDNINTLSQLLIFTSVLGFLSLALHGYKFFSSNGGFLGLMGFYIFPCLILLAVALIVRKIRSEIQQNVLSRIPKVTKQQAWEYVRRLTANQVLDLIQLRVTSLVSLANNVFMNRIRGLVYKSIYKDSRYQKRLITNLIYDLATKENMPSLISKPSIKVKQISRASTSIPTTLWFSDSAEADDLIASGQFTMCYNLLDHILTQVDNRNGKRAAAVRELQARANEDWKTFNENPHFLHKSLINKEEKPIENRRSN